MNIGEVRNEHRSISIYKENNHYEIRFWERIPNHPVHERGNLCFSIRCKNFVPDVKEIIKDFLVS
jgi:hypothetical protein